ncbi:MAG: hypothetical protein M3237_06270 [Actinomycetota bacterium]|nr:hypothetical protein [Actinomycetota bacterium]
MSARTRLSVVAAALAVATTGAASALAPGVLTLGADPDLPGPDPCGQSIELPYVAVGDGVPFGAKKVEETSSPDTSAAQRFPEELTKLLQEDKFPFCLHNVAEGDTTTDQYQDEDTPSGFTQQSLAHDLRPRLVTVTLGREQNVIREHITTCMTFIKNHQFIEANACALAVYTAGPWEKLNDDLSDILNQLKVQMDGNPRMVVAVMGYYNPYPRATNVATEVPGFCAKLQDTIPTCTIRWMLLPPALVTMDQITKKLNSTIEAVVKKFALASQGSFYFVNPYEAFEDHCMSMDVEIKTTIYHPPKIVHNHDSTNDFGCDQEWVKSDGDNGNLPPWHYLPPAVTGILINTTQTTKNMGAFPNDEGHDCLAKLVYNANNGWEPLKQKLGIPETAVEDPC